MPILLDLFLTFLKIGAVSFGGGYAMIPLVTDEALRLGFDYSQVMNFIAVAESTPGPIAINMATFIGASKAGVLGAIIATLGVVLPSFFIILLIASLIRGFIKYKGVQAVLAGLRPVAIGLIISTGLLMLLLVVTSLDSVYDTFVFNWRALVIIAIVATIHFTYKFFKKKAISPIILIVISAGLGMILYGVLGFI